MVIGSKDLSALLRNLNDLQEYAKSLLPKEVADNEEILNNQKYYIALHIRELKLLKFEDKRRLSESLLSNIKITGSVTDIYEIREIISYCNVNKLAYHLVKDLEVKNVGGVKNINRK